MGIKSIRAVEHQLKTDRVFQLEGMIQIRKSSIANHYKFVRRIGAGTYGEIFEAVHQQTGNRRAVKKINTLKFARAKAMILSEVSLLKSLDHPNILKIYQVYDQAQYMYIITEYCTGKQLFDVIIDRKFFSQDDACFLFYQIVSAVRAMHANRIMHRDLKPQNIMYDQKNKNLKIIDFGSGVRFQSSDIKQRKRVGTSYYIAPQVLLRTYNQKCDIWSLGVILYVLLVGEAPWVGDNDFKVMESIARGDPLRFRNSQWKKVSGQAKNLITRMLSRKVPDRPSAAMVMEDVWFTERLLKRKLDKNEQRNIKLHLKNMQIYKDLEASALQEGVLIFIVNFVKDKHDEVQMAKSFKALDVNHDGVISLDQLQKGLAKFMGVAQNKAEGIALQIFKKVDLNNSGAIDFSEFVMCAANIQLTLNEQNLDIAFDYIDADKSGKLSVEQIRQKLGNNISQQIYDSLLSQFDVNHDGQISRQQFKVMMKALTKKLKK